MLLRLTLSAEKKGTGLGFVTRYRVFAKFLVPVCTSVEAESEEEAVRIAKGRNMGEDIFSDWVLDETDFIQLGDLN